MKDKNRRIHIVIDSRMSIFIAMAVLLIPWQWICAWTAALLIHELFHYIAIGLCRSRVWTISVTMTGVKMYTEHLAPRNEFLCALAGPAGSFLLVCAAKVFPKVSLCALCQFICNLMPLYPLDGGRALRAMLKIILPKYATRATHYIDKVFLICIFTCALYLTFLRSMGPLPVIFVFALWVKLKKPCKEGIMRIQ